MSNTMQILFAKAVPYTQTADWRSLYECRPYGWWQLSHFAL